MKSKSFKFLLTAILLSIISIPGLAAAENQTGYRNVPYVPTGENVVVKMLDIAEVGTEDIVYDLGCGDGRIVIMAAGQKGARGVGIDIDPVRIRESRENARKADVTDRVRFIEQDLFEADLSDATVVTLYLLPSVNRALRPKLLDELEPGARIVSHDFSMQNWEPDQTAELEGNRIYLWVVPANVSGVWKWDAQGKMKRPGRLELKQNFQKVGGTYESEGETIPIANASLNGDLLKFTVEINEGEQVETVQYEGRAFGNTMEIHHKGETGEPPEILKAWREPATIIPLDVAESIMAWPGWGR